MTYFVEFVGLTGFVREPGRVRALMPDGRFTSPYITPHYASIAVRNVDLDHAATDGWFPSTEIVVGPEYTEFFILRPSYVTFPTGLGVPVDPRDIAKGLRHLRNADVNYQLASEPNWIACTTITTGTLTPFRWRDRSRTDPDDGSIPYQTEWEVPYDGESLIIEVTPRRGWGTRHIALSPPKDGSEWLMWMYNRSRNDPAPAENGDHFQIYEELSASPVTLESQPNVHPGIAVSRFELPIFLAPAPALDYTGCSGVIAD